MLTVFGYWSVSAFFFLSGYGLMEAYKAGGDEYIRRFPRKKIIPFYLTIWFFAILYIVKSTIIGTGISWERIPVAILYPGNLVANGWYLNTQLIFYWLFYIGIKIKKGVALTSLGVFLYVAVCITSGKGSTIYESVLPFILGLLCSQKKEQIAKRIYSHRFLCSLLTAVPFIITMVLGNINLLPEVLRMASKMISSCCFACFAVCISTWMQPVGLLQWLGTYSLGIYTLQGLWLDLDVLLTHGSIIYAIGVVLLTIISTVMITPIVNNIKRLGKAIRMRGNT